MEKDIIREFLKNNMQENYFYLECLENNLKKIDEKGFRLLNNEKVLKALERKKLTKEQYREKIEKFLDKRVKGKVKFRDVVQINYDNGAIIKILDSKYFEYPLISRSDDEIDVIDISKNIKCKILIGLMVNFETLFNDLLNYLIPKRINVFFDKKNKDKEKEGSSVPFIEILENPTKDFKQYVIEKQIEKLSYNVIESIEKIIDKLKLKDYYNEHKDLVNKFYEAYYRRNVIIHNSGKVNQTYLIKTNQTENDIKIGTTLEMTNDYIKNAEKVIEDYGCLIYCIFGSMLSDEDRQEYYNSFNRYAVTQEMLGKYETALFYLKLIKKFIKTGSASSLMCNFDICNCKKHLGDTAYKKEIEKMDCSALGGLYKVCKELLLDNYDNVMNLLEFYYPKEIKKEQIQNMPIFADFRNTDYYQQFIDKHSDEFYKIEEA